MYVYIYIYIYIYIYTHTHTYICELFLHKLLKFESICTRTGQVIRLQNIYFSETSGTSNDKIFWNFVCGYKVKLAIIVKDNPKATFSIATMLYPWYVPYNSELSKTVSSTIFESLAWLNLGLNSGLLGHWQTLYPLDW